MATKKTITKKKGKTTKKAVTKKKSVAKKTAKTKKKSTAKKPLKAKQKAIKRKSIPVKTTHDLDSFHLDELPSFDEVVAVRTFPAEPTPEEDVVQLTTVTTRSRISFYIGMFFGAIVVHAVLLSALVFITV